jgi:hypothetical protein
MRPQPRDVRADEGRDVRVPAAAAMALHADDLEDGGENAGEQAYSRWHTMLVSCMAMRSDPDMPRPCEDTDFVAQCASPAVAEALAAWNSAPHTPLADAGDELLIMCYGENMHARQVLIDTHMHAIDTFLSDSYPDYASTARYRHSTKSLMATIRADPSMLSLQIAIILFALSQETAVHRYFAGINPDGTAGLPHVNSERYNRFVAHLRAATNKLLTHTPPCTNPFIYAAYCAYFYVGCGSAPQTSLPSARHS